MNRKYFFFDIDGTLTDPDTKRAVPSAIETLHRLEEMGHFVAIATGRAHYKARAFADRYGIRNMVCSGGGGIVLNGKLVENIPLDLYNAKTFLQHAERDKRGILLMLDDSSDVYMKDYLFLEQAGFRKELTGYHLDENLDYEKLNQIMKIYMALSEAESPEWLNLLGHLRLTKDYIVCQFDAKKEGILRMLKLIDGNTTDVVVFGDDTNDLVMFDPGWVSIAMGNGKEALKRQADYVTDASVEDGIRNACIHFGWISDFD